MDESSTGALHIRPTDLQRPARLGMRAATAALTSPKHELTEDAVAVASTHRGGQVLVLCDGMGGMGGGSQASALGCELVTERLRAESAAPLATINQAMLSADRQIREQLCNHLLRPGTTAVVCLVQGGTAYVGWAGDSRALWIRDRSLIGETFEHRMVAELVRIGAMDAAQAARSKNARALSRFLGGRRPEDEPVEPEILDPWTLRDGDRIVLCSDGLTEMVTMDELIAIVTEDDDPDACCHALVDLARERGHDDDVTVCVAVVERTWADHEDVIGNTWTPAPVDPVADLDADLFEGSIASTPAPQATPSTGRGLLVGFALAVALALAIAVVAVAL